MQQSIINRLLRFVKILLKPFIVFIFVVSAQGTDIDIDKLLKVAKEQNKDLMFFHHIPGCPYCKTMLNENFKDVSILEEIKKHFVYVDVYTANNGTIKFQNFNGSYKEFSAYIGAFVYPATIFMNETGEVIHKAIGYRNIDEYFIELSYVGTRSYQTMDLESYSLELEFAKE